MMLSMKTAVAVFLALLVNILTTTTDALVPPSGRRAFVQNVAAAVTASALAPMTSANAAAAAAANGVEVGGRPVYGKDDLMTQKAHGTSASPVQSNLKFGVSNKLADRISNYNRVFAEQAGYFQSTSFEEDVLNAKGPLTFYDSVTGKPLFVAPLGRSAEEFLAESEVHGWPSFRDQEVVWDNVRVLKSSGETVSTTGTHLGHNLPDRKGNRYCINLVSVAGEPASS